MRWFVENAGEVFSRREGVGFGEFVRQCGEVHVAFKVGCDSFKSRRGFAVGGFNRRELRVREFSEVRVFDR